ncbi:TetR/AcrR family transcriptional regulator [Devosia nitrariae]|uniref:TetR family transcriptional regulator n=1 Tax=Devosia nitrariae TaxID=2071872 RepID=A0ABQ5W596_9HYPH|nr:TetR/AcrR family transcriptional regulator [Devosia nitrariae]GLQ55039.1 TetR family transcriptional regulator [Devosia nitrariae]
MVLREQLRNETEGRRLARDQHESKLRFLDATFKVVRTKGYTATRVEDVCAEAGLTKGSFFHHFKSKEDLALAAVAHWDAHAAHVFEDAPFLGEADPLDRLIGYIDFRKAILTGDVPEFTCFIGTVIQDVYRTHPDIGAACEKSLAAGNAWLEAEIRAAMDKYDPPGDWTPESLALHIEAVVQGGFVLAKAGGGAAAAAACLEHLRRYLGLLFGRSVRTGNGAPAAT